MKKQNILKWGSLTGSDIAELEVLISLAVSNADATRGDILNNISKNGYIAIANTGVKTDSSIMWAISRLALRGNISYHQRNCFNIHPGRSIIALEKMLEKIFESVYEVWVDSNDSIIEIEFKGENSIPIKDIERALSLVGKTAWDYDVAIGVA